MTFIETEHGLINSALVGRIRNNEERGRMAYYQFGQQVMSAPRTDSSSGKCQGAQSDALFQNTRSGLN